MGHVVVTTTLPVLDCPWLEKKHSLLRTISKRRNALSLTFLQRRHMPPFPEKLKGSDKPAHRGLSLNRQARSKPNQPRLLSTSYNSWHSMSNASWQLRGYLCHLPILDVARDFVTRSMQSNDKKRLIAHVVCLLVFRSLTSALQLWDWKAIPDEGVEGLAVWHKSRLLLHQKQEKIAMRPDAGPSRISSLRAIGSFSELAVWPVSPWDIPLRRGCVWTHTVPSIQKRHNLVPHR